MKKYVMDMHTHTLVSGHAYNTMNEMIQSAREKGLKMLGIADHGPAMPGSASYLYFMNLIACNKEKYGIQVRYGAELNIVDFNGTVDLEEAVLKRLDYGIASLHLPCIAPGNIEQNTNAYIGAMNNPYVQIIGHPDDHRYPIDYERFVEEASRTKVIIEVNNSSMAEHSYRKGATDIYRKLLTMCKERSIPLLVGSDAHIEEQIADFTKARNLLQEIAYPEQLILNISEENFEKFMDVRKRTC